MSDVNRVDTDRIHERLDSMIEAQTQIRCAIAAIQATLSAMPPPAARPCSFFQGHIQEHKEAEKVAKATWRDVAIKFITPAIYAAGGALVAFLKLGGGGKVNP